MKNLFWWILAIIIVIINYVLSFGQSVSDESSVFKQRQIFLTVTPVDKTEKKHRAHCRLGRTSGTETSDTDTPLGSPKAPINTLSSE